MIQRLSEADAFLAVGDPFVELSPVGENPSQITAGQHGRKASLAKPFPARNTFEPLEDFQEKIQGGSPRGQWAPAAPLSTPSRLDGSWGPRVESGHNRDHSCLEGPMKTLPLAHVKANLSRIVDQVVETDEEIVITRNGRPAAILVSPDEYEGWKETQAIRSDRELVAEIRRGLRTLKRGAKIYTLEELLPED